MYGIVQFAASEGGTVAVIVNKWLTPKKAEVFWPPTKDAKAYDKLLQQCSSPNNEQWKLYAIDRVFYETDHLDKAKKKLKLVEVTSDIQTEEENDTNKTCKRKIKKNNRYISSDEDDDECGLPHPPPLKKSLTSSLFSHVHSPRNIEKLMTDHENPVRNSVSQLSDNDSLALSSHVHSPRNIEKLMTDHENPVRNSVSQLSDNDSLDLQRPSSSNSENPVSQSNTSALCLQDKVISLLAHIKAQNTIIISILQHGDNHTKLTLKPEFKFPLQTPEELETVENLLTVEENYANVVAYFRSLGGHGVNNKVSRVMKTAFSDSMASKYNFYGKRSDKKPFAKLRLRACVVESLKDALIKEKNIEDSIKVWLKHAPERAKKALDKSR